MVMLVMQAHQGEWFLLRSQETERVLGMLGYNAHNACSWVRRRVQVSLRVWGH